MGCDIHLYREKKVNGVWVSADLNWHDKYDDGWIEPEERAYYGSNYELFGLLSKGVRSEQKFSFVARGMPFNCCDLVANSRKRWGIDGHSDSYLYLHELKDMWAFLQTKTIKISGQKNFEELKKLNESINSEEETDWSLLYPYCAWSNRDDYVDFEVDVPATLILRCLEEIIYSFEGIHGENHRIVFWFDN